MNASLPSADGLSAGADEVTRISANDECVEFAAAVHYGADTGHPDPISAHTDTDTIIMVNRYRRFLDRESKLLLHDLWRYRLYRMPHTLRLFH